MSLAVARSSLILLLAIWAGVVVGVSFLATPAKFLAPSLPMEVALDVGRHTFAILAWVELGLAAIASLLCWRSQANAFLVSGVSALWIIVLLERFWLLPLLDERVTLYLSGTPSPPSPHHSLFIAFEALKVVICLLCAAKALREFHTSAGSHGHSVPQQASQTN